MKPILYILAVGLLAVAALCKADTESEANDAPVKILMHCGSLVGEGQLLVLFEGEVSKFEVKCGGPAI